MATLTAVLGGAIAAKLQWHNLVAAYRVPALGAAAAGPPAGPDPRRPRRRRAALRGPGLDGPSQHWLLTGLAAAIVLLTISPTPRQLGRVIGFGLLGGAVGAVQLLPTVLLTTLSVRSHALSATDLFTSAATPFDVLLFGFQNAFPRVSDGAWDIYTIWYPDGTFALLEAAAFVGLPVLVLAAVGARGAPRPGRSSCSSWSGWPSRSSPRSGRTRGRTSRSSTGCARRSAPTCWSASPSPCWRGSGSGASVGRRGPSDAR